MEINNKQLQKLFTITNMVSVRINKGNAGQSTRLKINGADITATYLTDLKAGDAIALLTDKGNWYLIGEESQAPNQSNKRIIEYRKTTIPAKVKLGLIKILYSLYDSESDTNKFYIGGYKTTSIKLNYIYADSGIFIGKTYLNNLGKDRYIAVIDDNHNLGISDTLKIRIFNNKPTPIEFIQRYSLPNYASPYFYDDGELFINSIYDPETDTTTTLPRTIHDKQYTYLGNGVLIGLPQAPWGWGISGMPDIRHYYISNNEENYEEYSYISTGLLTINALGSAQLSGVSPIINKPFNHEFLSSNEGTTLEYSSENIIINGESSYITEKMIITKTNNAIVSSQKEYRLYFNNQVIILNNQDIMTQYLIDVDFDESSTSVNIPIVTGYILAPDYLNFIASFIGEKCIFTRYIEEEKKYYFATGVVTEFGIDTLNVSIEKIEKTGYSIIQNRFVIYNKSFHGFLFNLYYLNDFLMPKNAPVNLASNDILSVHRFPENFSSRILPEVLGTEENQVMFKKGNLHGITADIQLIGNKLYVAYVDNDVVKTKTTTGYAEEWVIEDNGDVVRNRVIQTPVYKLGKSNATILSVSYHP